MGWVGKLFIGVGVALAFLLVFGAVVAFTAYDQSKPYIEREYPTQLFRDERTCSPCNDVTVVQSFQVESGMREVQGDFSFALEAAGGTARLTIVDPSGDIRYERTFTAGASGQTQTDSPAWSAETGEWKLTRTYAGLRGVAALYVTGVGLAPGTL